MINFKDTIAAVEYFSILAKESIPSDYGIGNLTAILLWIARAVIIAIGGGFGLVKITKGKSDENPKEMNEGFSIIAAAGIIFAATFAVQAIF